VNQAKLPDTFSAYHSIFAMNHSTYKLGW